MSEFFVMQKIKKSTLIFFIAAGCAIFANSLAVFAHGGEDHGEAKAQTTVGEKGTIARVARIGDLELMIKHSPIEPDAAASGRLFITDFANNAPAEKVVPAAEIESANGTVYPLTVEKTETNGVYNLKFPALAAGIYALRAKVTYDGETDTATFSGVQIENAPVATGDGGKQSTESWLLILFAVIVSSLFGGLIYYGTRAGKIGRAADDAVSA